MTINIADNTPRVSYTVNAGATQTSFTVSFEFFAEADLNVYVDGTKKTISTHYTVSGGSGSTGAVAISVTGASGGSTVVITRSIALERTTDFPSQGAFQITTLNTELDRITAIQADLDDETTRSLRLADEDAAVAMTLPLKATRVGTVLGFNASTGAPEAGPSIAGISTVNAMAADIAALADIEDGTTATDAISGLAAIAANVTTVAGIASNVTSVAGAVSNINTLAASAVVADMALLATSDVIADMALLATSDVISDMNTLATSDIVSDLNTLATSDIVTDLNILATSSNVTNMATLGASGVVANIATVAGANSNITTVASNISGVNSFADRYRVASSDPSSSLDAGDLAFNTSSNILKFYNGSAWSAITTVTTGISNGNVLSANANVSNDDFLRVDGTSVEGRTAAQVLSDIAAAPAAGSSNVVTTGALNSGSITSGFGAINNGSSAITTTGTVSAGDVTVGDDVTVAGRASGHVTTDNDGSFDLAVGNDFKCTTAGGLTLTLTNPVAGQSGNIMFVNGGNHAIAAHASVAISAASLTAISATGTYHLSYYCSAASGNNSILVSASAALT